MVTKRGNTVEFRVYQLRCGNCGYAASSCDAERTKADMLEHLVYSHSHETE